MSYARIAEQHKNKLTREEEYAFIRQAQSDDAEASLEARDILVGHSLSLILGIAEKYANDGLTAEDLVGDGLLGLYEAIEKFDLERGTRLSTYAYLYVQGAICQSELIARQADAPSHWRFKILRDYHNAVEALKERGVAPTSTAVADELGLTPDNVEGIAEVANRSYVSLYQDIDNHDEGVRLVIDTLGEEDREVQRLEERDQLEFFVSKLDPTERQIVEGCFGISEQFTLVELSEKLGIERRKVATIRDHAVNKMQLLAKMDDARDKLTKEELNILEGAATFKSKQHFNSIADRFA